MKRYLLLGILISVSIMLFGCASTSRYPIINMSLTCENWQRAIETCSQAWMRGADAWFFTGNPQATMGAYRNTPYTAALSMMRVRVSNFTHIRVRGSFRVQIFGSDTNSVYVYGANQGVRQLSIEVNGDTLCINQLREVCGSRNVIVRIGVKTLRHLTQMGSGSIEGIYLETGCLDIASTSTATGNIFLSGNMNIRSIDHRGGGCIMIFGANTPTLLINACGIGSVNVCGNVGIRRIIKGGLVNINIIGANSPCLKIMANGAGKIGIQGRVNLQEVIAKGQTRVYVRGVNSNYIYVYACGRPEIGLEGCTNDLYVQASDCASFKGRYLCARSAFIKTRDRAHVNVTATNRIFASATQSASVYFYGSPNVLSQFVTGNGIVMPIYGGFGVSCCPIPTCAVPDYTCAPPRSPCPAPCYRGAG